MCLILVLFIALLLCAITNANFCMFLLFDISYCNILIFTKQNVGYVQIDRRSKQDAAIRTAAARQQLHKEAAAHAQAQVGG